MEEAKNTLTLIGNERLVSGRFLNLNNLKYATNKDPTLIKEAIQFERPTKPG